MPSETNKMSATHSAAAAAAARVVFIISGQCEKESRLSVEQLSEREES